MTKTFAVGDIHGAFKALRQVLSMAGLQENDRLIFLGDFVDGWSQSFEVIELLIQLQKNRPCVFIRGNHDTWCQQWLEKGIRDETWLQHGGQVTVNSYIQASEAEKIRHLGFFDEMLDYYVDSENRLFIHAGFTSFHGPTRERDASSFSWDRTLWETAVSMDKRMTANSALYPKRLQLFNEIFIGHTPTTYLQEFEPMQAGNVWNLDTGAAFNGKLTIMDINSKQFWQSDTVQELYPDETGRNNI